MGGVVGGRGGVGWEVSYKYTSDGEGNVIYDIKLLKNICEKKHNNNWNIARIFYVSSIEMSSFFF